MKKIDLKKFLFLLFAISLLSFGTNVNLIDFRTKTILTEKPKTAVSLGLAAWIIIAGDRSDHDKLALIRNGCDQAYEALINRGFSATDIYYLDPAYSTAGNPQSIYRDTDTTHTNIQNAITTWAAGKVDSTHGLGIYMFDHGGNGHMCIPGTPELTDTDLNTWLNTLETSTACNRVLIIYEACHAGSFINPVSKSNRIILTATDIDHGSYTNPAFDWATFSEGFWSSIIQCKTIGKAFEDAEAYVESVGDGDIQFPWIDDNHDELGHETDAFGHLPNGGDGDDALDYWIGTGTNCPTIFIAAWTLRVFINLSSFIIPTWTIIDTNTLVERVYVRVLPPNWTPTEIIPDPESPEGTKLGAHTGYLLIELLDQDRDGNYTGNLYNPNLPDFWTNEGDYKIDILAETQEGVIAEVETTYITANQNGTAPPDTTSPTISITNPKVNAGIKGIINITAEGDDDQALDKIQIYFDGNLMKEETMPPYYPYPEVIYSLDTADHSFGLHNITAIAIDKANNSQETSILVTIERDQIPGFHITYIFAGTFLGVIIIVTLYIKQKLLRRNII
ncbi:MAG: C13 family peptidase [Candidatus Hermodarchaeota archaeon]